MVEFPYKIKSIRILNYESKKNYFSNRKTDAYDNITIDSIMMLSNNLNEIDVDSIDVRKIEEIFEHREYISRLNDVIYWLCGGESALNSRIPNNWKSKKYKSFCFIEICLSDC